LRITLQGYVEGEGEGEILYYDRYLSLYGEVDPSTSVIKPLGVAMAGKILVVKGIRGSTVGPYVMYALYRRGLQPSGIIAESIDPLLAAAAVLSATPLASIEAITALPQKGRARLIVKPPSALLEVNRS